MWLTKIPKKQTSTPVEAIPFSEIPLRLTIIRDVPGIQSLLYYVLYCYCKELIHDQNAEILKGIQKSKRITSLTGYSLKQTFFSRNEIKFV